MAGPLEEAFAAFAAEMTRKVETATRLFHRFEVVTDTPLTVTLDGGSTVVSALKVNGQTYSIGNKGLAIVLEGSKPVCIKVEV